MDYRCWAYKTDWYLTRFYVKESNLAHFKYTNSIVGTVRYFQPCCHWPVFFNSCQSIKIARFVITASMQQINTAPSSSNSISETMKCFSLFWGLTAVHLLLSNFLGLIWCIHSPLTKYLIKQWATMLIIHQFLLWALYLRFYWHWFSLPVGS